MLSEDAMGAGKRGQCSVSLVQESTTEQTRRPSVSAPEIFRRVRFLVLVAPSTGCECYTISASAPRPL